MDYKVSDNNKKINAIRHQRAEKIKRLELLQTQYDAMVREAAEALATDAGESFDAQVLIVVVVVVVVVFSSAAGLLLFVFVPFNVFLVFNGLIS